MSDAPSGRGELSYELGPFRIDVPGRLLTRDGAVVSLTPKAFDTLLVLVERQGQVVTKQQLLEAVWPDTFVGEATLTQNVYTLRKVLSAHGEECQIETLPRRGYRLTTPVRVPVAETASAATASEEVESVAVLPFQVLGMDRDCELLGLGMADVLITGLSRLPRLIVRPTSAVVRYAERPVEATAVARELGVDAVLEGTVQRIGTRTRVTAQLVGCDAQPLWAKKFDAIGEDPFYIQDAVSTQVEEALHLELARGVRARPNASKLRGTRHREAYQAYLRGRFFWNRRTEEGLVKALGYFRQATDRDAAFAQAFAGLADAYVLLPFYGARPPKEVFPEARAAAIRALEIDGELAEAHTSLAYTQFIYERHWQEAEDGFRRAIELSPGYPTAHHWYGFLLAAMGRHDEARREALRSQELDPLSLVINTDLGLVHYFARRYDKAVEQFHRTLELDPGFAYAHFGLGLAYEQLGRHEQAVQAAERGVSLSGDSASMLAVLGYTLAMAGRRHKARRVLDELSNRSRRQFVPASHRALVHVGLGELDAALEQLEQACAERSHFVAFLSTWPIYDALRGQLRFDELCGSSADAAAGPVVCSI